MPGQRCLIQSSIDGAQTFLVSAFARVTLLNPQWTQTIASGGSSSLAQCGQRGTSSPSLITSIFDGPVIVVVHRNAICRGAGVAAGAAAGFASGTAIRVRHHESVLAVLALDLLAEHRRRYLAGPSSQFGHFMSMGDDIASSPFQVAASTLRLSNPPGRPYGRFADPRDGNFELSWQ